MGFKEKVDNYLEEQRRIKETKEKAEMERSRQQEAEEEALLKKKITEYQRRTLPLIGALNKTPVRQWLEEIKAEEGQLKNARIYLLPSGSCLPSILYAEVKLAKIWNEEHDLRVGNPDNEDYERHVFEYEISIGIGARYNERKIQFYSIFHNDTWNSWEGEEKNICLNDDSELNQKIEKALIVELSKLRQRNK